MTGINQDDDDDIPIMGPGGAIPTIPAKKPTITSTISQPQNQNTIQSNQFGSIGSNNTSSPQKPLYGAHNQGGFTMSIPKKEEPKPVNSGLDGGLGGLAGLTEIPSLDFEVGGSANKGGIGGDEGGY